MGQSVSRQKNHKEHQLQPQHLLYSDLNPGLGLDPATLYLPPTSRPLAGTATTAHRSPLTRPISMRCPDTTWRFLATPELASPSPALGRTRSPAFSVTRGSRRVSPSCQLHESSSCGNCLLQGRSSSGPPSPQVRTLWGSAPTCQVSPLRTAVRLGLESPP